MKTSPVIDKLSPTLFRYLDEFPKFEERKSSSGDTRNLKSPEKSNDLSPGNITVINNNTHTVNEEQNSLNNTKKIVDSNQNNSKSTTSNEYDDDISKLNEQTSTSRKAPTSLFQPITSTSTDINHPCKFIDPEFRKYLLIVSKTGNIISNDQCEKLLDWFFDRFRVSNNLEQLLFNNDAVTLFEGKLYIACMNEYASDWVKTNLEQYPESYAVQSLNEGNMCDVVIPMVSNNKKLSDVFELLEKQNSNLNTLEWYVVKRRTLLSDDDATNMRKISTICSNELVSICIDNASKKLLSEYHLKLKYCFWQIVFNFAST